MNEALLAYHCAPALAGIKPANIVSLQNFSGFDCEVKKLNNILNSTGIYIEILCECKARILVMVYRRKQLFEYLSQSDISDFLASEGYPKNSNIDTYISFLKKRLENSCEFPHEIGAFLGYPIHDIYGFINKKQAVFTGYWKVYENADEAKLLFARFDRCRSALIKKINSGKSIAEIFGAA